MARLVAVDYDPFASQSAQPRLTPVDYDPFAPTLNARASGSAGAVNKKSEAIWGGSFDDWKKRKEADDAERARMVAESEAGNVGSRRAQEFQRQTAALNEAGLQRGEIDAGATGEMMRANAEKGIGGLLEFAGGAPKALADFYGFGRNLDETNAVTEAGAGIGETGRIRERAAQPLLVDRPESLLSAQGLKYIGQQGAISLPTTGAGLAISSVNPALGLGVIGGSAAGSKFSDARAEGRDFWLSTEAAAVAAATEAVPEMLPMAALSGRLLKYMPTGTAEKLARMPGGRGVMTALAEGGSEVATELGNLAYEIEREGRQYTPDQVATRLVDSFAIGTAMGGVVGGLASATGAGSESYERNRAEVERIVRESPRATTARILGPTATPDAAAGAQIADDAFRAAGVGTVAAADMAEQDALARDLDAATRDQLGSEAEIDRLLTGGINGETQRPVQAQAQPSNGRTVLDGQDAGRAGAAIPGISGSLPAGVRTSYPGDSAESGSSVGFVGDGGIGSRNATAPQQFTELADGSIFVPGDPVLMRQRLADSGAQWRGMAQVRDGVQGVRFGRNAWPEVMGAVGGVNTQGNGGRSADSVSVMPEVAGGTEGVQAGAVRQDDGQRGGRGVLAVAAKQQQAAQLPTQAAAAVDGQIGSSINGRSVAPRASDSAVQGAYDGRDSATFRPGDGLGSGGTPQGDGVSQAPASGPVQSVSPALRDLTDDERNFWPALTSEIRASIDNPGGRLIRNADGSVGRTKWADLGPMSGFWRERPAHWNSDDVLAALDRAQTGEKLSVKQRNIVDYAKGWVRQYSADNNADLLAHEQDSKAAQRESMRDDIESTLASVADTSPQQRSSTQSLGGDYTAKLLQYKKDRRAWGLNPQQEQEYQDLLELDRETGKVGGRPMVGVRNKTAYVDALDAGELLPVQGFTDADDFKTLNDKLGHAAGDDAIREIGEVLVAEFGEGNVFHRSGDEFLFQGTDQSDVDAKMQRVRDRLSQITLRATDASGNVQEQRGIGLSYGTGTDEASADAALVADKQRRKESGQRVGQRRTSDRRGVGEGPAGERVRAGEGRSDPAAEGVGDARQVGNTDSLAEGATGGNNGRVSGRAPAGSVQPVVQAGRGTVQSIRAAISAALGPKFLARLDNQKKWFQIVDTVADLPPDVRKSITGGGIAGFVLGNRVYVVAEDAAGNPVGVLLHELGVHYGMAGILGEDFAPTLAKFKRLRAKDDRVGRAYERATEAADKDANGELTEAAKATLDEEALAYFVEQNWNEPDTRGIVAKVIDAIKRLLNRLGMPLSMVNASPELLREVAIGAARMAADGRISVSKDGTLRYMFAGRNAKTANIGTLEQAQAMIAERYDPDVVRQKTGWHQGADGKWRFEIDDSGAKFIATRVPPERLREINQKSWNHGNKDGWMTEREFLREYPTKPEAKAILLRMNMETDRINWNTPTLGDVLDHPELYAAYPGIRGIRVAINNKLAIGRGAYAAADNAIVLSPMDDKDTLSVLLHEIQHGIQEIEGFAKGGSPLDARNVSAIDLMREENARFQKMQEEKEASPEYKEFVRDFIANLPESERSIKSRRGDSMIDVSERLAESAAREKFIAPIEDARRAALDAISKEDKNGGDIGGMIGYRRLAGEVEARNVQARQNLMGDETRRAISPQSTQDVPDERQVVRYSRKADGGSVGTMKFTPEQTTAALDESRWFSRGTKARPSAKVYRGVSERSGTNAFTYGRGLYTTLSKSDAAEWGRVVEVDRDALPSNPIRFDSIGRWQEWEQFIAYDLLNFRRRSEFESEMGSPEKWVRDLDPTIDGVQIGTGADAFFVKWPPPAETQSDTRQAPPREGLGASGIAAVERTWDAAGISAAISERNGVIKVGKIVVPQDQRGRGIGTDAMRQLTDYADATGQRIVLSPSADFGGDKGRLVEFYKRTGFVENKGRGRDLEISETMYREPKQAPRYSRAPTITINGTERPTTDSTGKAIHPAEEGVRNFWEWFGSSRATDEDGRPLALFHGTDNDVESFDKGKAGSATGALSAKQGFWFVDRPDVASSYAEYAAQDAPTRRKMEQLDAADKRAQRTGNWEEYERLMDELEAFDKEIGSQPMRGQNVIPAYVSLKNPAEFDAEGELFTTVADKLNAVIIRARRNGNDGVIVRNVDDDPRRADRIGDHFLVFAPEQIKSSTGNSGAFSPTDARIAYSRKTPRTAEQAAALAKAGMPEDNRTLIQRGKDYLGAQWASVKELASSNITQSVFDRFHRMSAIEQDLGIPPERSAYLSARLAAGLPSIMEGLMMYAAPKWEGGVLTVDDTTVGLLDALKPVKDDINGWLGWMVGRRAKALKAQGRENLMTDTDIDALLSLSAGKEAAFKDAALKYLRIKKAVLDVAEQAGLIDPVGRASWDSVEYIPFYRQDETEGDTIGPGTRQGLSKQSSGIQKLKGGQQNLADPLGNIVRNFTRLIDASLKNNAMLEAVKEYGPTFFEKVPMSGSYERIAMSQVKKVLLDRGVPQSLIDAMPQDTLVGLTKLWAVKPPTDDDVVRVMRDGKPEYYRVPDKDLLASLTAFKVPSMHWALSPFKFFKKLLTVGVTSSPEFMARNFVRDSLSSWVISDDKFRVGWDSVKGIISPLLDKTTQKEMMFAGGSFIGGQFYSVGSEEATADALRRALRDKGLKSKDVEQFVGTIARTPLELWDKWQKVGSYFENANRNAIYENAIKAGRSKKEAAYLARDLMDFSMHGNSQFIQFLSDVLPFFNARLQGLYKLYRQGGKKALRKALLVRAGTVVAGTLALMAWNMMFFADGYDELEEWDKDTYWHIMPGTPWHIRVPKPFELGVLFATVPERLARAVTYQVPGGDAGDRPRQTLDSFLTQVGGTLAMNPIPQGVMPIVEQWANKTFFTGRPIENMGDEKLLPEARAEWYTSDTARVVSDVIGNKTGLSPKRIEHLWNGYTGTVGAYALDTVDWLVRSIEQKPERPELAWAEMPLLKAFYRGDMVPKSTRYSTEFYEIALKTEQISNTIKDYEVAGQKDKARALEEKHADLLGSRKPSKQAKAGFMHTNVQMLNKAKDELAEIRKQIEGIVGMPGFSAEQKREKIEALAQKRNKIARDITVALRRTGTSSR